MAGFAVRAALSSHCAAAHAFDAADAAICVVVDQAVATAFFTVAGITFIRAGTTKFAMPEDRSAQP